MTKERRSFLTKNTTTGVILHILLSILFLLQQCPSCVASLIASSKIQYCTNDGTDPIACTKKMVVTLTVDAGQLAGVEEVTTVTSATDDTNNGVTAKINPVRLTTSRSLVRYRYPVFYVQAYNAKPYELVIPGTLLRQCNADFDANKATCGVSVNPDGTLIPLSQGFCCSCGLCATVGLCADDTRAQNACNVLNTYTQASCLRFGPRWYSGYSIGSASTFYSINVTMTRNTTKPLQGNVGTLVEDHASLFLSPDQIGDVSKTFGVQARLIGDFNPTEQPLVLTQRMLFIPSLPQDDPRVTAGPSEWMILDKNLVTLDGRECDKVGVSYEAFASQGNACRLNTGSCLNSQLEDLRAADQVRIAAGKKGLYMALSLGTFDEERYADIPPDKKNSSSGGTNDPYISYLATTPAATMITLTIAADDLQYVVAVSPGKILSVAMNHAVLDASSPDGELRVEVQNTGSIVSRYTIEASCGLGIFPITSQIASLEPLQRQNLSLPVAVQSTSAEGQVLCTVTLRDSQEAILDTASVGFEVKGVAWSNGTQGGTSSPSNNTTQQGKNKSKCDRCTFFSFACSFNNLCGKYIVGEVLFVLGIVVLPLVLLYFRRQIMYCVSGLCCCCDGTGPEAAEKKKRRRKRHRKRRPACMASASSPDQSSTHSSQVDPRYRNPTLTTSSAQHANGRQSASPSAPAGVFHSSGVSNEPNSVLATLLFLQQRQQQHEQLLLLSRSMQERSAVSGCAPGTGVSLSSSADAAASAAAYGCGLSTTYASDLYSAPSYVAGLNHSSSIGGLGARSLAASSAVRAVPPPLLSIYTDTSAGSRSPRASYAAAVQQRHRLRGARTFGAAHEYRGSSAGRTVHVDPALIASYADSGAPVGGSRLPRANNPHVIELVDEYDAFTDGGGGGGDYYHYSADREGYVATVVGSSSSTLSDDVPPPTSRSQFEPF